MFSIAEKVCVVPIFQAKSDARGDGLSVTEEIDQYWRGDLLASLLLASEPSSQDFIASPGIRNETFSYVRIDNISFSKFESISSFGPSVF